MPIKLTTFNNNCILVSHLQQTLSDQGMNAYSFSSFPRSYSEAFKQEALRQLSYGRSLDEVSGLLGVSKILLIDWMSKASSPILGPLPIDLTSQTKKKSKAYSDRIKQQPTALTIHPEGYADEDNPAILPSGKNQAVSVEVANPGVISADPTGSQLQPSQSSEPPPISSQKLVRQRRYDPEFKRRALFKIQSGLPIRQVAHLTGVSELTLHRWKKAAQVRGETLIGSDMDQLRDQLQLVMQELDALRAVLLLINQLANKMR